MKQLKYVSFKEKFNNIFISMAFVIGIAIGWALTPSVLQPLEEPKSEIVTQNYEVILPDNSVLINADANYITVYDTILKLSNVYRVNLNDDLKYLYTIRNNK